MANSKTEKILIIEADAAFGEQVEEALKKDGYEDTHLFKSGLEGIKSIYDFLPHLVIMDITLPGMDGYEILAKKDAEKLLKKIPVFLISTQGVPVNMRKVPEGSVTEFLVDLHLEPKFIVEKLDRYFNHEISVSESAAKADPNSKAMKILWVEDDKFIGTILAKKLINSGFDLFHANNGEEALEALRSSRPDAIVVDLLLPGMSGFEILQKVKQDPGLKDIPCMVLSNLSKPSDIEKARVLGAKKFLVKAATSLDQIVAEVKAMAV